jgi:hypothetical protein
MTLDEFRLLAKGEVPEGLSGALLALHHDKVGDWDAAHESSQAGGTRDGAWVHAYLHRKEGDLGNAGYWYRRAGRPVATGSLDAEWARIAGELLKDWEGNPDSGGSAPI